MSEQSKGCLVHYDSCHIQVRRDYFQLCAYDKSLFNKKLNGKGKPVKDEPNQECMAKLLRLLETLTNTEKAHDELVAPLERAAAKEYPLELSWSRICALLFNTFGESIVRNSMAVLIARQQVRVHQETSNSTPIYFFQSKVVQKALDIQAKQGCENTTRGGVKIQPVGCENTTINNSNNNGDKRESVDAPTLQQPNSTHTLSDVELIALCQQRGIAVSSDDVDGDYENTAPSMQLSTASEQSVDNSHSENHSQSYSHKPATSKPTHVGVMPVLTPPMPPTIEGVKMPDAPPSENLDEKKRLGLIAELIRERAPQVSGVTIPVLKFLDAWDREKYGPCALVAWEVSSAKEIVTRHHGTVEDALLLADYLKAKGKEIRLELICGVWNKLTDLKKPVTPSYQPKAFNADDLPKDVWA